MNITKHGRSEYTLELNREEAIELIARLGEGVGRLKTRQKNAKNRDVRHDRPRSDSFLHVACFSTKDPERTIHISFEDLPLEAPDAH